MPNTATERTGGRTIDRAWAVRRFAGQIVQEPEAADSVAARHHGPIRR